MSNFIASEHSNYGGGAENVGASIGTGLASIVTGVSSAISSAGSAYDKYQADALAAQKEKERQEKMDKIMAWAWPVGIVVVLGIGGFAIVHHMKKGAVK